MNAHWSGGIYALGKYMPMRARYDAKTEDVAWQKLLAFFDAHMPA